MALILDTGPVVAALDAGDPDHARCAELIASTAEERVIPAPVLVEVEYLLRPWPDAFEALVADCEAGHYRVFELAPGWLSRATATLARYRDLGVGLVDVAVLLTVEAFSEERLATLDHRHFAVLRPAHCEALELLPAASAE